MSKPWRGRILDGAGMTVYLFHLHVLSATLGIGSLLVPGAPAGVAIAASVLAATGAGVLIHLFVEKPLLRMTKTLVRWQRLARSGSLYGRRLPR